MKPHPKPYNFIYRTDCVKTGKYYLGRHSTDDLNDGYLGSGTQLLRSLKKHGKENHIRHILAQCGTHEELVLLEQKYIHDGVLKDPLCMNLTVGGHGDFFHVDREKCRGVYAENGRKNGPINISATHTPEARGKAKSTMIKRYGRLTTYQGGNTFKHTISAISKIKANAEGRVWINNGTITKRIKTEALQEYMSLGFSKGRV